MPPPPPGPPPPVTIVGKNAVYDRAILPGHFWYTNCWVPSPPLPPSPPFLSVYFFSVSFCPCLPGPLGLDKLPPTSLPCPLTA